MNLNHVHLGTKNLKVFEAFYNHYFGFKRKSEHGSGAFLTNDSGFLIAVDPIENLPALPDWYHLGFCLEKEKEVLNIYEKMKTGGANIVRELRAETGVFASFFVKDPERIGNSKRMLRMGMTGQPLQSPLYAGGRLD
jgi:catechol-2,3-dioxygenase